MTQLRDSELSAKPQNNEATTQPERNGDIIEKVRCDPPATGIECYEVTYISDELRVKGALLVPNSDVPLPGLVYCRGGIRSVGMVRIPRMAELAGRGYVVFAPYYRGNEGGEGREDFCGEDRNDLFHALTVIRSLPEVSPEPLSLIGFSRGAVMALLAARECAECANIGAVVVWGGVSDMRFTYEERTDLRRMLKRVVGHPEKQAEAYADRSPIQWADRIRTPVLIVHGTEDKQVSVEHAHRLHEALLSADKPVELMLFEGEGHRFSKVVDDRALTRIFDWFSHIKKKGE